MSDFGSNRFAKHYIGGTFSQLLSLLPFGRLLELCEPRKAEIPTSTSGSPLAFFHRVTLSRTCVPRMECNLYKLLKIVSVEAGRRADNNSLCAASTSFLRNLAITTRTKAARFIISLFIFRPGD